MNFRDVLHRFRVGRVMGNSSLESNLLQKLAVIREELLYEVFLYL